MERESVDLKRYTYDEKQAQYTVSITTEDVTAEEKRTIEDNLDIPPEINNDFEDILITSMNESYKILIDAVDENGDEVYVHVKSSHPGLNPAIDNSYILTITPDATLSEAASRITVMASAGTATVEKSFIVLAADEQIDGQWAGDSSHDICAIANMLSIDLSHLFPKNTRDGSAYCSIQDAIDNAFDGDTIVVPDGAYSENISFTGKALTLRSAHGPISTVIDGNSIDSVVKFNQHEGGHTLLQGFTIRNGRAQKGGGIACDNASFSIINCIIQDNKAEFLGGGMYCDTKEPRILNCLFERNEAHDSPNHITIEKGTTISKDMEIMTALYDRTVQWHFCMHSSGMWRAYYRFFGKPGSEYIPSMGGDFAFISIFSEE
ncbi:MAG: hypothetical protein ACMUJM_25160 [bacterium]